MSPLGGFRETGSLPLFSPRRAHLLTTASAQTPYPSPRRERQGSSIPLCLLFPQSQRLCGSPFAAVVCPRHRALCEADAASAEASRQCNSTCECCCHRLRRRQNTTTDVLVRWVTIRNPPAACLRKPAAGSFAADRASLETTPFSFCEKETKSQSAER